MRFIFVVFSKLFHVVKFNEKSKNANEILNKKIHKILQKDTKFAEFFWTESNVAIFATDMNKSTIQMTVNVISWQSLSKKAMVNNLLEHIFV